MKNLITLNSAANIRYTFRDIKLSYSPFYGGVMINDYFSIIYSNKCIKDNL